MSQSSLGNPPRRRRSRLKRLFYRPEAWFMAAATLALRPLTLRAQLRVGAVLGRLAWLLSPRRAMSVNNARRALGVGEADARRIARASHLHLGRAIVEFLTSTSYLEPHRAALIQVENFQHLRRAHAEGHGVIMATAHLGNWELGAIKQALEGIPLLALGREPKNPYLAKRLQENRKLCGNEWLPRNRTLLYAAKGLKAGRCVAMAIDQHTRTDPKITTEFLGRRAMLSTATLELAVRLGCPVVLGVTLPEPEGGYRLVYRPALYASGIGSRDEQVRELAGRCHRMVENLIRENPDSWFWFHDLWKGVPQESATNSPEPSPTALGA